MKKEEIETKTLEDSKQEKRKTVFDFIVNFIEVGFMVANVIFLTMPASMMYFWISLSFVGVYLAFLFVLWYLGRDIEHTKILLFIVFISLAVLLLLRYKEVEKYIYFISFFILGLLFMFFDVLNFVIYGRVNSFEKRGFFSDKNDKRKYINKNIARDRLKFWIVTLIIAIIFFILDHFGIDLSWISWIIYLIF